MQIDPKFVSPVGTRIMQRLRSMAQSNAMKSGIRQTDSLDTQALAQRFVLQRAISRIFESEYGELFALKGGMLMMHLEEVDPLRARGTEDIDIQIPGFQGGMDDLARIAKDVFDKVSETNDDGIRFDTAGMKVRSRPEESVPGGSILLRAYLGTLNLKFKIDVTFDSRPIFDVAEKSVIPSILGDDFPPITVRRVPFSWTLADKIHAQVRHGADTTRLKDFYDMYLIVSKNKANPEDAIKALRMTFDLFGSPLPTSIDQIAAFGEDYAAKNDTTWETEKKRYKFAVPTPSLPEVCRTLRNAIGPLIAEANKLEWKPTSAYKKAIPLPERIAERIQSMRGGNTLSNNGVAAVTP